ncbi:MAG TPA: DUF3422 domain-containing protein [bacterium]|nr:DUF3422 domain-containing protein [bacterium]
MDSAAPVPLPAVQIHKELHARVAEPVTAPCRIRHSAYLLPEGSARSRQEVQQRFEEIARGLNVSVERIRWGERSGRIETALTDTSRLRVVWEMHTEFYSYTTYHLSTAQPSEHMLVPSFTFPAMPTLGTKLVDLDVVVLPGLELTENLRDFLGTPPFYGGLVVGQQGRVWTSFQVDTWGQGRYVVRAGSLAPGRLGRLIRRLVEIENYYHLILLPLEEYRLQVHVLREMEDRITRASRTIATALASEETDTEAEHRWLVSLTGDLAELVQLTERMRYRFSAADSYYAILLERLRWLRERTGEGYQSMEEFLTARVAPAVRNYRNFTERSDTLAGQLTSLGNMLRTRVNLSMERQSLATMRAMDRRFGLQLQLQYTVEGLSVIVLTYYLVGLAADVARAVETFWHLPGRADLWAALTIPFWLGLSFFFTRRVKRAVRDYMKGEEKPR